MPDRHDEQMTTAVVVRPVEPADHDAWAPLFAAYREFYELDDEPDVVERVWGWIQDEAHEEDALVALSDGEMVGFAHHRMYARPAEGGTGLFLDDLFTAAARAQPRRRTGADQPARRAWPGSAGPPRCAG